MRHITRLTATLATAWLGLQGMVSAGASARPETVVLVVPASEQVLRVALDASARFRLPLLAYQQQGMTTSLHQWEGGRWKPISAQAYGQGTFLPSRPARAFVVSAGVVAPDSLFDRLDWDREPYHAVVTDTGSLVNALGATLAFRPSDWRYFAARHDLQVNDLNAPRRRESWYTTTRAEDIPSLEELSAPPAAPRPPPGPPPASPLAPPVRSNLVLPPPISPVPPVDPVDSTPLPAAPPVRFREVRPEGALPSPAPRISVPEPIPPTPVATPAPMTIPPAPPPVDGWEEPTRDALPLPGK